MNAVTAIRPIMLFVKQVLRGLPDVEKVVTDDKSDQPKGVSL